MKDNQLPSIKKSDIPEVKLWNFVDVDPFLLNTTFQKWARQECSGVQLHVSDRQSFLPYRTGVAILAATRRLWPDDFAWRTEMYEFRDDVPAIDLLTGRPNVREEIDAAADLDAVMQQALIGTEVYDAGRDAALLY